MYDNEKRAVVSAAVAIVLLVIACLTSGAIYLLSLAGAAVAVFNVYLEASLY